MPIKEKTAYAIGIDPGKTTGIAIAKHGVLIKVFDSSFWDCIDTLEYYHEAIVIVELPTTKHVWHNGATNKAAIQRTGVNVGSCIREAELLVDWLIRKNRDYVATHPIGKRDAESFKRITGWKGRTNPHQRDAGMLCFGVTSLKRWAGNE